MLQHEIDKKVEKLEAEITELRALVPDTPVRDVEFWTENLRIRDAVRGGCVQNADEWYAAADALLRSFEPGPDSSKHVLLSDLVHNVHLVGECPEKVSLILDDNGAVADIFYSEDMAVIARDRDHPGCIIQNWCHRESFGFANRN